MAQTRQSVPKNIQLKMIELLESPDVHAMVLMGFARRDGLEPLIVVAHDMPRQDEFIKEFYDLCDRYIDFRKVQRASKTNGGQGEL